MFQFCSTNSPFTFVSLFFPPSDFKREVTYTLIMEFMMMGLQDKRHRNNSHNYDSWQGPVQARSRIESTNLKIPGSNYL